MRMGGEPRSLIPGLDRRATPLDPDCAAWQRLYAPLAEWRWYPRVVGSVRARAVVLVSALCLVSASCIPMPPGTFNPDQFSPGLGPNVARASMFMGLGAWWDVWDWSPTFTNNRQKLGLGDVDRLARNGTQVLYIQTASYRRAEDVLDPGLLRQIIDRAHANGMRVVGWYLPEHVDDALDMRRMVAAIEMGIDGFGMDIESRRNPDEDARNRILVSQVQRLRARYPNLPMAAIPVAPVVWEELNATWWPNFPYAILAAYFDAWMPQNYWSYRKPESGLRDAYTYNVRNIQMLRDLTGVPWLPVHPIGGEAAYLTPDDVVAMYRAIKDTDSIGGSLYDDASTPAALYDYLKLFRIPK
jgi:hypothetical protein